MNRTKPFKHRGDLSEVCPPDAADDLGAAPALVLLGRLDRVALSRQCAS